MISLDLIAVVLMEVALVVLYVFSKIRDVRIRWIENKDGINLESVRGESSMSAIHVMYGIVTVICSLVIQVAEGIDGNRVIIIFLNYLVLTHLFFSSLWFRNSVVLPAMNAAKKD